MELAEDLTFSLQVILSEIVVYYMQKIQQSLDLFKTDR